MKNFIFYQNVKSFKQTTRESWHMKSDRMNKRERERGGGGGGGVDKEAKRE